MTGKHSVNYLLIIFLLFDSSLAQVQTEFKISSAIILEDQLADQHQMLAQYLHAALQSTFTPTPVFRAISDFISWHICCQRWLLLPAEGSCRHSAFFQLCLWKVREVQEQSKPSNIIYCTQKSNWMWMWRFWLKYFMFSIDHGLV